jgi:hypothetical protein
MDNLNEEEHEALKQLAKDESIIISKADKGNAIVIQDKVDYTNKLLKLIDDKSKFECLEDDPTLEREKSLNSQLYYLKDKGTITNQLYNLIRPVGSKAGTLYGLPKVYTKKMLQLDRLFHPSTRITII